jgi:ferritin-like metal-binding protein YciE
MPLNTLQELLVEQLRDLYDAERQVVEAGPRIAAATSNSSLAGMLHEHVEESREHRARLERIFELLGESPKGERCVGMEGLVREASRTIRQDSDPMVLDAAVIADVKRIEHYEITAYATARGYARLLGYDEIARLLNLSLVEELAADNTLSTLAEISITPQAALAGPLPEQ